ncbi:hypothetical protein GeomeDRAFT_3411 [Geobacter metallireducens RCH3]|uniref:Lipoprotein, putative n=1 Tax=Geobacter metallireducens (strain ATCC 53774 / DSM 7210 / GS-15) TaxID=269799 RepID=Q39SG5_GEOMG|nr:DUF4410 domain-containing protein [Geobacter metallireducens]ABB32809.1 lipoprotein, putative [Geobacter metallireducens GS-15]EHP83780.1 hypothetical protein GeomeDRAFT_3411 [Geobacter metallireducens RCH3]
MFAKVRNASMVFLCAMFLAACSSSGTFTMKQALIEPINNQKTVSIWVKSDKVPESEKEDAKKACSSLQEKLYARLVSEGLFKSSVIYPNKGDYSLEVDVLGVRLVSNTARLWLGVMAGASGIETNVLLRDETGKVLAEFNADGSSATHPMSSESGSDNAVNELATEIAQALKQR